MVTGSNRPSRTAAFTLVELMVVLAIVAILMALAVPTTRMFFQGDQERGARELYSLIRAARVYAVTYRVNTAVAYEISSAVPDTLYGTYPVQVLQGAMMVYELPKDRQAYAGYYVPTPGWGTFRPFKQGYCVLLQEPPKGFDAPPPQDPRGVSLGLQYRNDEPSVEPPTLGLRPIRILTEQIDIEGTGNQHLWTIPPDRSAYEYYPAHCFDPTGKLIRPSNDDTGKERYRIFFAPMPDRPPWERLTALRDVNPEDTVDSENPSVPKQTVLMKWADGAFRDTFTMIGVPIEIYRSTGRVEMGKL